MATGIQALELEYVQKPQDGSADAVLHLALAPSYVTYHRRTIDRVTHFFHTEKVRLALFLCGPVLSLLLPWRPALLAVLAAFCQSLVAWAILMRHVHVRVLACSLQQRPACRFSPCTLLIVPYCLYLTACTLRSDVLAILPSLLVSCGGEH